MKNRANNATLFLTVLSACMGLLMTGAPAYAQAQRAAFAGQTKSHAKAGVAKSSDSIKPVVAELLGRTVLLPPVINVISDTGEHVVAQEVCYQNTIALTGNHRVLIVTRLPRAALNAQRA